MHGPKLRWFQQESTHNERISGASRRPTLTVRQHTIGALIVLIPVGQSASQIDWRRFYSSVAGTADDAVTVFRAGTALEGPRSTISATVMHICQGGHRRLPRGSGAESFSPSAG